MSFLVLATLLSACATPAREIEPAPADPAAYVGKSCIALFGERGRLRRDFVFASLRQDQISRDDRIRIFGAPTLFGSIFEGDGSGQVARLKGQIRAIEDAMIYERCAAAN